MSSFLQWTDFRVFVIGAYMDEHGVHEDVGARLNAALKAYDSELYDFLGRWMNGSGGRDFLDYEGHEHEFAEDLSMALDLDVNEFGLGHMELGVDLSALR